MANRVYTAAHASVRFFAEELDPLEVTLALRLPPDHTHRRGEPVLRRVRSGAVREARAPYSNGMWSMSSRGIVRSPLVAAHVEWLLSELEPKAGAIRSLRARGVTGDLFCYSYGATDRPPSVANALRRRAEALGLRIEVDHHAAPP